MNHGFDNGGWYINGYIPEFDIAGQTTTGNQGSPVPFAIADVPDTQNSGALNFWYGTDDGSRTNLFNGPQGGVTFAVNGAGGKVFILADNVFGNYGADEFSVTFHGATSDLTALFIGGDNTKDYNTPNCATTGCAVTAGASDWFNDGYGIVLQQTEWVLPQHFGLNSITFTQDHPVDGAIIAGVTLGTPEPATWALMLGGFGLAGAALRRRRVFSAA